MSKMETLCVVHYIYDTTLTPSQALEVVTNDFDKWLEEHNKNRKADGEMEEKADDFSVEEVTPVIY
jgi:hypothetical protein